MKIRDVLDILSSSEIILEVDVIVLVEEPGKQALRAKASLKNGFLLQVNEALGKGFRSYSYHLQKNDKLVRRWDNAPHWPEMNTFPHHLHLGSEREVRECQEIFIEDALSEIKCIIESIGNS
ncbi:MAG: DUF6516 family protein [Methanothrix sp.]|uniref:toxin-antitoxin system TumE family protein n=1 Tax=Methanothrix sp. TaxID=90426 RepID=UPI003BB1F32F